MTTRKFKTFITEDGYTFFFVDGVWTDRINPDDRDLTLGTGKDGMPVDIFGPVDGTLVEGGTDGR